MADVVLDKMAHDYDDLDLAAMAHERRAEYLRRKSAVRTIESAYKEHANGHPQSVDERADWGTIRFVWTDHDADEFTNQSPNRAWADVFTNDGTDNGIADDRADTITNDYADRITHGDVGE